MEQGTGKLDQSNHESHGDFWQRLPSEQKEELFIMIIKDEAVNWIFLCGGRKLRTLLHKASIVENEDVMWLKQSKAVLIQINQASFFIVLFPDVVGESKLI